MSHTEQRQKLRAIFAGTQCFSPATVYDALSARVAESVGFQIGMLAGSVASNTTLAAPDLIVITLTEFADQVRRIMRSSNLSLVVDADHGYGNALNAMRTVQETLNERHPQRPGNPPSCVWLGSFPNTALLHQNPAHKASFQKAYYP
jgi:2-methylisocitrate lyase-like PEP mutase family enzyme